MLSLLLRGAALLLPKAASLAPQIIPKAAALAPQVIPKVASVVPQVATLTPKVTALASKIPPGTISSVLQSLDGGNAGGSRSDARGSGGSNAGSGIGAGGGRSSGNTSQSQGGGPSPAMAISSAVKSVSGAFTSTFATAGKAVSNTATSVAAGAKSVVGNTAGAVTSAVSSVTGAVSSITSSLGPVGAIIGGVASAVSTTVGAVVNVTSAIANTVITAGTAVLTTVTTIATSAVSVIGGVLNTAASLVSTLSGLLGSATSALSALGTVATAVAGVFSGIASAIGSVIGALASVVSGIVSAVTSIVGAPTSAFESVSQSLGALAGIAGQAIGGFISAVQSSVEALMSYANNVTSLSNHTGMSLSAASSLTTDMRSVGISASETAKMFGSINMRPELFNMRSDAVGLARMDDPNFEANEAAKYQALVKTVGIVEAQARLKAQFGGQIPESILRLVNRDPKKIQADVDYGRNIDAKLGISPAEVNATSEGLASLMNRIGQLVESVKMRFAADLLPSLQAGFSMVSDFLAANAGNISNILKTATRAIFVEGPDLALNAALTVLDWAQALSDAFFAVGNSALDLVEQFANRDGAIYGILRMGAGFIDQLTEFGAIFQATMAYLGASVQRGIHLWAKSNPLLGFALNRMGVNTDDADPGQAYQETYEKSPLHLQTSAQDMLDTAIVKNSKDIKAFVADKRQLLNTTHDKGNSMIAASRQRAEDARKQLPAKDEIDREWQRRMAEGQQKLIEVAQKQLDAAKDSKGLSAGQVLGRIGAYIAEDAYRLTSR